MQNLSASAPSQADEKENKEINLVSPASRGTAQASPGGNGEPTIRFLMVKMLAIATMAILFMIVVVLLSQFVDRLYSSSEQAVAAESALESFSILCLQVSLVCIGFYLAKNSLEGTAEVFDNLGGSGFDHKRFNPTANAALLGFFVVLGADGVVNRSAKLKKYFFGQQWTLREAVNRWLK